jgi:hypothetical protein
MSDEATTDSVPNPWRSVPSTLRAILAELADLGVLLAKRDPEMTNFDRSMVGVRLKRLTIQAHAYLDAEVQARGQLNATVTNAEAEVKSAVAEAKSAVAEAKLNLDHYVTMQARAVKITQQLLVAHAFIEGLADRCDEKVNAACHHATSPERECDFHRRRREALALAGYQEPP